MLCKTLFCMSGHSKWATTKRQKAVTDAKRSGLFTKLAKNISIAAREGTDPKMNFKLRMAIDKARDASMPKENIGRAIARGSGTGEGQKLERIVYEGFGPQKIAVIVETVTDNKNRTFSDLKHYFAKSSGSLGPANSVRWMFDLRGVIAVSQKQLTEVQELGLIDSGLLDTTKDADGITLICELEKLPAVKEHAEKLGLTITDAYAAYVAKERIKTTNKETLIEFLEGLDELDDVDSIYTNADL